MLLDSIEELINPGVNLVDKYEVVERNSVKGNEISDKMDKT